MNHWLLVSSLLLGCASSIPSAHLLGSASTPRGPWGEVAAVEMSPGDTALPIGLIQDVADALLKRPGARVCDPVTHQPIVGLSMEYCSTVYVAGTQDALSWRVTEPVGGSPGKCEPFSTVHDVDYPASQVWVVGYIHNHPCGSPPSSLDMAAWPTDAFDPYTAMAEVRLIPGNPHPARQGTTAVEMTSALVAERQDGTRLYLRYFPTGEVQQWSPVRSSWIPLGTCAPRERSSRFRTPRCNPDPLQPLRNP